MNNKNTKFTELLIEQIAHEFGASQQYLVFAVFYDNKDLPQLAQVFYNQSIEERNHALMIIQYLLDRDIEFVFPDADKVNNKINDIFEPIALALEQEKTVTEQITNLASTARAENDYLGENFMQWFIKEQVEEVSKMNTLLTVAKRTDTNLLQLEEFISREIDINFVPESDAPKVAGV